jgi:hypothetical protein
MLTPAATCLLVLIARLVLTFVRVPLAHVMDRFFTVLVSHSCRFSSP